MNDGHAVPRPVRHLSLVPAGSRCVARQQLAGAEYQRRRRFSPLNVFRKGDDVVIITELPGTRKADLQIQVKDRTIRLAGIKPVEYGEKAGLYRRERLAGSFDRAVTLPVEIDADRVTAEYHDGILALYLPRAERDKPKAITVA
jgi:HSP20 family protein